MSIYARPTHLDAALRLLSERTHRILAGGTDVYPADGADHMSRWTGRLDAGELRVAGVRPMSAR